MQAETRGTARLSRFLRAYLPLRPEPGALRRPLLRCGGRPVGPVLFRLFTGSFGAVSGTGGRVEAGPNPDLSCSFSHRLLPACVHRKRQTKSSAGTGVFHRGAGAGGAGPVVTLTLTLSVREKMAAGGGHFFADTRPLPAGLPDRLFPECLHLPPFPFSAPSAFSATMGPESDGRRQIP